MAITAASLIAAVSVTGAEVAEGKLAGVGAAADSAGANFAKLALVGSAVLVGSLVAVGVKASEMAANFQQAVNRLRTGAGDTQDSFAALEQGILKVSTATGLLTGPLSTAMYEILSSGQRGAQAFDTLTAAAKGAVIEQANVKDVADTLAGAMTNFGTKTFGASAYMNGLIKAVSLGRITLQDLSTAMGPIEPVAKAMGISFADLSAAMSTQTNAAIPAARAATGLRFMMQALEVPTAKATKAMQEWGLNTVAVADEMKVSLPGALQMIYDAAKKAGPEGSVPFNRAVSDMVGGQRSLSAFLALTGTHMKDFSANAAAIAASMKTGQSEVQGWEIAQSNFNVQVDRAKASFDALMITLGNQLLPLFTSLVGKLPNMLQGFSDWAVSSGRLSGFLKNLGDAIQVAVTWTGAFFTQLSHNGALVTVMGILRDLGDIVRNVVVLAFQLLTTMMGGSNEGAISVAGSAKAAADAFAGLAEKVKGATGFLSMVTGWFTQTGLAGDLLRDALLSVAAGFLAIKVVGLITSLITLATVTIPALLVQFGFMAGAAATAATATGAVGVAAAGAGVAATTGAGGLAVFGAGLTAMLGPIALVTAGLAGILLGAKSFNDWWTTNDPLGKVTKSLDPNNPLSAMDWSKPLQVLQKMKDINALSDQAAQAQKLRDQLKQINQAWSDMESLYGYFESHNAIPGVDTVKIDAAQLKVIDLKSHLDDLSGPINVGVLDPAVVAARQHIIDYKAHIDDIKGPTSVGVLDPAVVAARQHIIDLKSHIDDLKVPTPLNVPDGVLGVVKQHVSDVAAALNNLMHPRAVDVPDGVLGVVKQHAQDAAAAINNLTAPRVLNVVASSVQNAISTVQNLTNAIFGIPNKTVYVNTIMTTGNMPKFASGVENFGGGLAYVHGGEVLAALPRGTSVFPASAVTNLLKGLSGGANAPRFGSPGASSPTTIVVQPPDIYLDGVRVSRQLMPFITSAIRNNVSSGFGK